jgi:alpha-N-acetylglucosamine transferase
MQHMDELFFLPSAPVALPRAYWVDHHFLTSLLMVIQPSSKEFQRISHAISSASPNDYDMEIVNQLYNSTALILPHRRYALLSCVFREWNFLSEYLGSDADDWSPSEVFDEAKLVHFSDWPVPKPWIRNQQALEQNKPACENEKNCRAQEIWLGLYSYFASKRKVRTSP